MLLNSDLHGEVKIMFKFLEISNNYMYCFCIFKLKLAHIECADKSSSHLQIYVKALIWKSQVTD